MKKIGITAVIFLWAAAAQAETIFAEVVDGRVVRVIVAEQEFIDSGRVGAPSRWKKFTPSRKNYPGVGYSYDAANDTFVPPKPSGRDSWRLNKETHRWEAPKPIPQEAGKFFQWNEQEQDWREVTPPNRN